MYKVYIIETIMEQKYYSNQRMEKKMKRNRYTFGLGTIGRDMVYTLISMYLMFYLTDIKVLDVNTLWWVTAIILGARIFDAFNDPVTPAFY